MTYDQIELARRGDRDAFSRAVEAELPKLRRIARRMIGHPDDAEDVLQEGLLKAWSAIGSFEARSAFSTWVAAIVSRAAVDHLRRQKRWRTAAQVAYANLCAGSEEMSDEVMSAVASPDFAFEVREHVAYCFSCVGRSLPPDEQAALVVRDVLDLSSREASNVLGISDSVLRHRLTAARTVMQEKFEGLCALVNKSGICHQCAGLRMVAPEGKKGGPFPEVTDLADRMAVVRTAEPGSMGGLHDVFWRRTKEIEEAGVGSTTPDADCREADEEN